MLVDGDPERRAEEATKKFIDQQEAEFLTLRHRIDEFVRPRAQTRVDDVKRKQEICERIFK